jgi:S-adenosylmethionine:tRNA ribosyltransferase-isomerase
MLKTSEFNFELPQELVAQYPAKERGQSRLMTLDRVTGTREHKMVADLQEILCRDRFLSPRGEKPLLVFNDTKVRKARLIGKSEKTGAEVEFLLLEKTGSGEQGAVSSEKRWCKWKAMVKKARRKKTGSAYFFYDNTNTEIAAAIITGFEGEFCFLEFDRDIDDDWLDKYGHIPLPPYIKRADDSSDAQRYQTVYAKQSGSTAAPTAGLHFTDEILSRLSACGIESVFITLHVGLGTFLPVRSENIDDHVMHKETFFIDEESAAKIEAAKAVNRKVVAVGTTSVRTLESAWCNGQLKSGENSTSIFIYPGYKFNAIDAIFTNFHTPESTLLMLVCAFAGKDLILESYKEATLQNYRFFSYGDAMLIH